MTKLVIVVNFNLEGGYPLSMNGMSKILHVSARQHIHSGVARSPFATKSRGVLCDYVESPKEVTIIVGFWYAQQDAFYI